MNQEIEPTSYHLCPGYVCVLRQPSIIRTVLGAGVAVSLWDKRHRFGGMCHFELPTAGRNNSKTTRFGDISINILIKEFIDAGAKQTEIEAQIFGGGSRGDNAFDRLGQQNINTAKEVLTRHEIRIVSEDTGGQLGRKVLFHTKTGQAVIWKTTELRDMDWYPN